MLDDVPNTLDPAGLWLSITELAEAKGLGKAAVSERVARFEAQGLITTRAGKGKVKLVNLAEYDRVAGQVTDLAREQGAATRRGGEDPPESTSGTYTREQARRMQYQADLSRLELEERLGALVRVDRLQAAISACGEAIVQAIDRLPQASNDLAIAVAKDGEHGLRAALKLVASKLRTDVSAALTAIAAGAPAVDPATDEDGAGGAD